MGRWDGKMGRGCRCCIYTPSSQRAQEVPLQTHHKEPWAVPEAVPGYPGLPKNTEPSVDGKGSIYNLLHSHLFQIRHSYLIHLA